ncbi:hypothetical protein A3Q56_06771 [Intoshia linei]|uniref:Uncharacterized protein n=1 Tax=Intoshia linei TaxID=1819745 RepID=A0A177AVQ8_9BILA|nr:hypothetical protein A3Q56_06771 [Intoshia linei]
MWLNVISTSPTKMSWSFLIAGFGYISILSSITFTLGLTYWSYSLIHQNFIEFANRQGNIVTLIADLLYKVWGQLLVVIVIIMTSFVTLSSQILSIASIVIYDIYIPFIAPCETYWCEPIESNLNLMRCMSTDSCINTVTDNGTDESQEKKLLNEYNKRCMLVKHVVILGSGIILLIFMVVHNMLDNIIEKMWIYKVGAILFSGVLMPLIFSLIWDGCSGIAFVISSITSSISSITVWICLSFIFSKVEQNSLLNNQFENLPYDNIFEKNKTIFTQHQFILLENKFFIYTNANEPILFSLLLSILLGSILCIFISLIHNKCKQSKKKVKNMTLFDLKNYQDVREPPLHYYQKVSLSDALERLRWKFYKMEKLKSVNFKSIAKIQVHIKNSYTLPNDCCTNYVEYMSVCVTITAIILLVVVFPIIAFFLQPYGVTLVAFKLIVSAIMVVVFLSCLMFIFFPLIGIVYNVVIACIHCCIPKKKISKSQLNCSKNYRSVDCQLGHQTNSSNFDEFQSLNLPEKKESHVKPIGMFYLLIYHYFFDTLRCSLLYFGELGKVYLRV